MNTHSNLLILCALSAYIVGILIPDVAANTANCPGTAKFYEDIGCIPIYRGTRSKCPYQYMCTTLEKRDPNKCYLHGREFKVGRTLSDADKRPDELCRCEKDTNSNAAFICLAIDCFISPTRPGCYRPRNATEICPGDEICPTDPKDRSTCEVDGKVYLDGESFEPTANPHKQCYCGAGYNGANIAPYCTWKRRNRDHCKTELFHADFIAKGCAPLFEPNQSPSTDCPSSFRCPKTTDRVASYKGRKRKDVSCKFGNLTMGAYDMLSSGTDSNSDCVKCHCEVGPVLTCLRLPESECNLSTLGSP